MAYTTNNPNVDVAGGTLGTTIADGADVAQGATTDAAVTTDVNATNSSKLRGLVKILADVWDSVNDRLKVDGSGVTQPVSGTVTANQGTAGGVAWPVKGDKTNNGQAPGVTNLGTLPAIATAAAPSYTEGQQVGLSTDLAGTLRSTTGGGSGSSGAIVVRDGANNQRVYDQTLQRAIEDLTEEVRELSRRIFEE